MHASFSSRIRFLSICVVLIGLLIVVKLFFLQVIHAKSYAEAADRQYVTPEGDVFDRGAIYFTKKDGTEVSAASIMLGYKVALVPNEITDPESTFTQITSVVPLERKVFDEKIAKENDPYEEIADHLTKDTADALKALAIPGVHLFKQKWRVYPGDSIAARTLGFIAYKGDDLVGRYGLERSYNDILARNKDSFYVNFFAELFSGMSHVIFENKKGEGDIVITIDPEIEQSLEHELEGIIDTWHSDLAGGIVMNPKTGEIYAMATLPSFNLNEFSKVTDQSLYGNPLVENVYELGSIIKTLTMSAGINEGLVTPETTYDDKGFIILNTERINNFDKKARGITTMQEVLNQSLNTGATFVMQKLGQERFKKYFLSFGIGQKSGIDLPGEVNNLISNLKSPRDLEYANASFGQGIALTSISAVRAFSAIANKGVMVTPHMVRSIRFTDGTESILDYPKSDPILKEETTVTMARMMTTIVDTALLGGNEKLDHYTVAAKTGTAQIALPGGKGYYEDRYLHSMYGFYPAYDPQFLVFFFTVNPRGINYSANTLGRPFMSLARFLLSYYEVPPDR